MVFEVFRRNQKQMLVALTCLAMFAFVLGGFLDKVFDRTRGGGNPVVASMWGRDVRAADVQQFREGRRIVNTFVDLACHELSQPPMQFGMSDEQILNDMLLLGKAEKMGITADDGDVTSFLNEQFDRKLDAKKFHEIISGRTSMTAEGSGRRGRDNFAVGEQQLYALLAKEIKIGRVQRAIFPAALLTPPYRIWESEEPVQTKIQLELVRMPLEKFVDKTAKPDETALKQIYDKYKGQTANPTEDQPGFLIPRKVEAQYLAANVDKFLDKATASDDEIKAYYEANKGEFRIEEQAMPLPTGRELPGKTNLPGPPTTGADLGLPPATKTPPPPPAAPASKSTAPETTKPATPAAKDAKDNKAPKAPNDAKKTSMAPTLNSWLATIATTGAWLQAPVATKKDQVDATKAVPPPPAFAPGDSKPSERFKPLADVKGEVAKRIKREKARKLIVEKMDRILRETMYPYLDNYERQKRKAAAVLADPAKPAAPTPADAPPPPPDLAKIAADNGFELKTTGLVDFDAASKLPKLGTAIRTGAGAVGDVQDRFATFIFKQDLYRARIVRDAEDLDYFLYWKIKDQEEKAAKFEDVREQVVQLWREEQAVPKAKAAAEKLAEDAKKAGGDLTKVVTKESGLSIYTTGSFTKAFRRMPDNNIFGGGQLMPNQIPGVANAGMDFLDEVFKLKVNDIKVLADQPKRLHYVVKVKSRAEESFESFVATYNFQQIMARSARAAMMQDDYGLMMRSIGAGIVREADFKNYLPQLMGGGAADESQ